MEQLKTLAVIYEIGKEPLMKHILDKLMFNNHCFIFIQINPKVEGSYTYTEGDIFKLLRKKLDGAHELYIINPKGTIARYMRYFLGYAEETNKPIYYLYKFCYTDCRYRKGKVCSLPSEMYFEPGAHNLLPACESYTRIYDELIASSMNESPVNDNGQPSNKPAEAKQEAPPAEAKTPGPKDAKEKKEEKEPETV